jgi:hypothetical protein
MSWAAHIRRVPADWDYEAYNAERDPYPCWPKEACTHYQFWQSKTDPSPVSPIFATIEEMADWALEHTHWPYFEHFHGATRDVLARNLRNKPSY